MTKQKIRFDRLTGLLLIVILGVSLLTNLTIAESKSDETDISPTTTSRARQVAEHVVFAEYFTTEWCVYCPSALAALEEMYDSSNDDFYFVTMMLQDADSNTISQDAVDRADEYGISSYPTVEFDGGYIEVVGGQSDTTNYENAHDACTSREMPDVDLEITAQHMSDASIDISVNVINNGESSYSGNLKVYVAEVVSRYLGYDGEPSSFGFLDFAIDSDVSVGAADSKTESTTWDGETVSDELGNEFGDINPDNIIIFAALYNGDRATLLDRHQESSMYPTLYFADEAAAAYLSGAPPDDDTEPEVEIIAPYTNEEVIETVRIEVKITDDGGISNVDFDIDNAGVWTRMYPLSGQVDDDYFAFWNTKTNNVPDGQHTITVRATDIGKNQGEASVVVTVANYANDKVKPVVKFKDIADKQEISGSFDFQVTITDDSEIDRVRYRIDQNNWNTMKERSYNKFEAKINTSDFSDGKHTLSVEAKDRAGNVQVEILSIKISNNPSDSNSEKSPIPGFEGVFLIGLFVCVVIFYSYFNKK
jgi:thiol-disulfide isomerase/thioredoxin